MTQQKASGKSVITTSRFLERKKYVDIYKEKDDSESYQDF